LKNLKIFIVASVLLNLSGCGSIPIVERGTYLGPNHGWIFRDERIKEPPSGCRPDPKGDKHDYLCGASYGVGYQATSPEGYATLEEYLEEKQKELAACRRNKKE
jgi:hypothetical protein